jgi:hypothetical protein
MALSFELTQGTAIDLPIQLLNRDGTPAANVFLTTDTLAASVWQGSNETPLVQPAVAWGSSGAAAGQIVISLQNADSASLAIGQYYLQAFATRAGTPPRTTALLPRGSTLEILPAPGTSFVARPTYISIVDVRKIAPWIEDLQAPQSNTGFDDQLADARDWLDELVLRNYRGGNVSLLGYHGFALDAWYTGGGRRTSLTNRWLKQALAANQLLVTPRVKLICAYYALSRICESFITKSGQYVALAARFRYEAEALLASTTVELDINNDGFGEVPVNFTSTNTLWA